MGKNLHKRVCAFALAVILGAAGICSAYPVYADATLTHGTSDTLITEDMRDLEGPSDSPINESMQADASEGLYDKFFLKDSIQTVSIELDENNLNYLLQNAADKPSVLTQSVTIGDETIYYTGLKTKGNYTLEHSVSDNAGSDRFSFTINFGKYVKKADFGSTQNFYGCSKISFNNFYFDKSMLKEYMALSLMTEMGLPTPQYGLAKLYINGEYYGVYFMVEAYDSSILEQYYGVDDDVLSSYLAKPEQTTFLYEDLLEDNSALWEFDEEVYADVEDMLPTVMDWVEKLNQLSEGTDFDGNAIDINSEEYLTLLGEIMDVDEVVRYFATHSFLCQMDNMFMTYQNFGLYVDTDGRAILIPWDYDLSFGCYYPSDSETTANYNIDVMFSDSNAANLSEDSICWYYEDYPLFHVIYQNEYLRELYHTYMEDCSKIMALGGTTSGGVSALADSDSSAAIIAESALMGQEISGSQTYDAGYFATFIDTLREELIEAASEELADHVYYMNGNSQPSGVKTALSNLAKIMAMRSLGVMAQVEGWDATVCGEGCDLSTLGNAVQGWTSSSGILMAIDAYTGIYTTADYGKSSGGGFGWPGDNARSGGTAPTLSVSLMAETDTYYQEIADAIGVAADDSLVVYNMTTKASPEGDYTLTIPLSSAYAEADGGIRFYAYDGKSLTELEATQEDNRYSMTVSNLKYIVVVQEGGNALSSTSSDGSAQQAGEDTMQYAVIAIVVMIAVILIVLLIFYLMKNKKKSAEEDVEKEDLPETEYMYDTEESAEPEDTAEPEESAEPEDIDEPEESAEPETPENEGQE